MVCRPSEIDSGPWDWDAYEGYRDYGDVLSYREGLYGVELNPGLEWFEVQDAWRLIRWFKGGGPFFGIAGTMLVSGPRRSGKDLFGNVLSWKIKRYFKGKHVLRDDHPSPLFGSYKMFNEDTVVGDVARMAAVSEGDGEDDTDKLKKQLKKVGIKQAISEWTESAGKVLLQNAVLVKTEFWKDMNKRRPMDPMNLVFGGLLKTTYHIDMLLIGTVQRVYDLDRFTCLPDVNLHARCEWCMDIPNTTRITLYHVQWSEMKRMLVPTCRPREIFLNGGAPQAQLGGKRWFDIFNSKSAPNLSSLDKRVGRQMDVDAERAKEKERYGTD